MRVAIQESLLHTGFDQFHRVQISFFIKQIAPFSFQSFSLKLIIQQTSTEYLCYARLCIELLDK